MYRSREDVYSFRDILSFPQFSQKKKKTKEKDLTRILVEQTKPGMRLGGQFLEIILYFVNPSLEFLHFLSGIPERYIHT